MASIICNISAVKPKNMLCQLFNFSIKYNLSAIKHNIVSFKINVLFSKYNIGIVKPDVEFLKHQINEKFYMPYKLRYC
jgi:hypothetical protein